ncbi:heat repeat-containing protein : Marine sediment metagenome DNA, contig: S01H1_L06444 (Fragment) OS=marine sediment metagenome GN=S01H1_15791 PE=4 SV=1 [Gemmata massiliana]|uniref:Heat repeat-containing protein: Marine sediment metagenome DNA, contig: S01H1_L06444 n=1 Tax=Gemmata massiliana TaxID=1210884 RepID=A0A6P2D2G5_9BACT
MRAVLALLFALVAAPTFGEEKANKAKKPEPKYEGKPLGYWVSQFLKGDTPEQRQTAVEALCSFGPDAAPALPTFTELLLDHSEAYRLQVLSIVKEIGPAAKDARPILLKMLKNKKTSPTHVVKALVAISPEPKDAALTLAPLLEDPPLHCQDTVYRALCDIGPDAKDAIPAVQRFVMEQLTKNPGAGIDLALLHQLGPDVVPLLVEVLDATNAERNIVLDQLEKLGPKAASAAPALAKLLKDENLNTRYRAATLLWKCAENATGVPVLTELLTQLPPVKSAWPYDDRSKEPKFFASDAANALSEIGPKASTALPALRAQFVVGLGAAVKSGVCLSVPDLDAFGKVFRVVKYSSLAPNSEAAEIHTWYHDLVMLGQAAEGAITKIEQGPKK